VYEIASHPVLPIKPYHFEEDEDGTIAIVDGDIEVEKKKWNPQWFVENPTTKEPTMAEQLKDTFNVANKTIVDATLIGAKVEAGKKVLDLVTDSVFTKIPTIKVFGFNLDKVRVVLDPIIRAGFVYSVVFAAQFSKRKDFKALAESVAIANGGKTLDDVIDPLMAYFTKLVPFLGEVTELLEETNTTEE
jgi:hypothetical protein